MRVRGRDDTAWIATFLEAQDLVYDRVLGELADGRKRTHWMWFIFPQLAGLGFSAMSRKFAIRSLEQARSYLDHEVLGPRLLECTRLVLAAPTASIVTILGYPDDLKFRSCMTLFAAAAPWEGAFQEALDRFFAGAPDPVTLERLREG